MFVLPETLTIAEANAAVTSIEQALASGEGGGELVVDAAGLRHFDTAAIAVLIQARRLAQAGGRGLVVHGAPASMLALSTLYGVDGLLGFDGARSAAPGNADHSGRA